MVAGSLPYWPDSCVSHLSSKYLTFPDFIGTCKVTVCVWRPPSISPMMQKQNLKWTSLLSCSACF